MQMKKKIVYFDPLRSCTEPLISIHSINIMFIGVMADLPQLFEGGILGCRQGSLACNRSLLANMFHDSDSRSNG